MLSIGDVEDEIIIRLENSIRAKEQRCELLRSELYEIIDSSASPLKDKIIDATIDDFSLYRSTLMSKCQQLVGDLTTLKMNSEPLSVDIQGLEILKDRLEGALDLANVILDIRSINTELKESIQREDFDKATQLVVQFRSIQNRFNLEGEGAVVESVKASERQLIQIVGRKFREGVVRDDREVVSSFAKLFYPLNLHKEGIFCYINFLRESMNNQCASKFKVLSNAKHPHGIHTELAGSVFMVVADLVGEHQKVR